jgi:hypothetical protein
MEGSVMDKGAIGGNRRSLLTALGAAAIGLTFGGALEGCSPKKKAAPGSEEPKLNF